MSFILPQIHEQQKRFTNKFKESERLISSQGPLTCLRSYSVTLLTSDPIYAVNKTTISVATADHSGLAFKAIRESRPFSRTRILSVRRDQQRLSDM